MTRSGSIVEFIPLKSESHMRDHPLFLCCRRSQTRQWKVYSVHWALHVGAVVDFINVSIRRIDGGCIDGAESISIEVFERIGSR